MIRSFVIALLLALVSPPLHAQTTVRGAVRDSVAGTTLRGALVQLVAEDGTTPFAQTVLSGEAGLFEFSSVPNGRYILGFHHEQLDALGLEPIARPVDVQNAQPVLVDLATPSPARYRRLICGTIADDGGVLVGLVRDASTRDLAAGANVSAEWLELSISGTGISQRRPRREVKASAGGWFALCDVPRPGTVVLQAARGTDSTDRVEWTVPNSPVARRDLWVGRAVTASAPASDTTATSRRSGTAALRGVVVAATDGRGLAGAIVSVPGGAVARANASGEFTLTGAPAGTRVLDVRAVGHFPERRVVDLLDSSPPARFALNSLQAVMDTVRATARRTGTSNLVAFEQRRREGQGQYLSADDIRRRAPVLTTDLFRAFRGVYWDGGGPEAAIQMRGIFGERCVPTFYLDGAMMNALSGDDLDLFVKPEMIVGLEVYTPGTAPPQFQNYGGGDSAGAGACGSIVMWTR
jgi:hypothetical protein